MLGGTRVSLTVTDNLPWLPNLKSHKADKTQQVFSTLPALLSSLALITT